MAYLQLAEGNNYSQLAEGHNYNMLAEGSVMNNYLTIPPGFMGNEQTKYVRIDYFDNLPDEQFALTMAKLAPFQPVTLLSAKGEGLIKIASFGAGFIPGVGPIVSKVVEQAGPMAVGLIGKKKERKKAKKEGKELKAGEEKKFEIPPIDAQVNVGGQNFGLTYEKPGTSTTSTFFTKYKTPLLIGGAVVALVGGYMILKKKK